MDSTLCPHDREEILAQLTSQLEVVADILTQYPRSGIAQRLAPIVHEALCLCDAMKEEP